MGDTTVTVTVTFTEDQAKAWLDGVAYARLRGHGGAELPEDVEDALYASVYEAVYEDEVDENDTKCNFSLTPARREALERMTEMGTVIVFKQGSLLP